MNKGTYNQVGIDYHIVQCKCNKTGGAIPEPHCGYKCLGLLLWRHVNEAFRARLSKWMGWSALPLVILSKSTGHNWLADMTDGRGWEKL